jgi:regulator of RNase E activity RraB
LQVQAGIYTVHTRICTCPDRERAERLVTLDVWEVEAAEAEPKEDGSSVICLDISEDVRIEDQASDVVV